MGERTGEGEEEEEERESGGCSSKGENAGTRKKKTERSKKDNKHIDCVMTRVGVDGVQVSGEVINVPLRVNQPRQQGDFFSRRLSRARIKM